MKVKFGKDNRLPSACSMLTVSIKGLRGLQKIRGFIGFCAFEKKLAHFYDKKYLLK